MWSGHATQATGERAGRRRVAAGGEPKTFNTSITLYEPCTNGSVSSRGGAKKLEIDFWFHCPAKIRLPVCKGDSIERRRCVVGIGPGRSCLRPKTGLWASAEARNTVFVPKWRRNGLACGCKTPPDQGEEPREHNGRYVSVRMCGGKALRRLWRHGRRRGRWLLAS